MKKLFFILFATVTIFSSCSSDNDGIVDNDNNNVKTYNVKLNVESSIFSIDKNPLKSTVIRTDGNFLQVVAYKESGELYSSTVISSDSIAKIKDKSNSSIPVEIQLPEGKYHISLLSALDREADNTGIKYSSWTYDPKNYDTDFYKKYSSDTGNIYSNSNHNVYFTTVDLTVSKNNDNQTATVAKLNPMWSEVNISLTGLSDIAIPTGTTGITIVYKNLYWCFPIKTGIANATGFANHIQETDVYTLDQNNINTLRLPSVSENNSMILVINYVKKDSNNTITILDSREVDLSHELENGYIYNVSGTLKDVTYDNSTSISLGQFNSTPIDITF